MLATINRILSGTCLWCCQKSDEIVEATFADGFHGMLCRKHFWEALKVRAEQPSEKSPATAKGTPTS